MNRPLFDLWPLLLPLFLHPQATETVLWARSPWRWSPSARAWSPWSTPRRTPALSPSKSPSTCPNTLWQMVRASQLFRPRQKLTERRFSKRLSKFQHFTTGISFILCICLGINLRTWKVCFSLTASENSCSVDIKRLIADRNSTNIRQLAYRAFKRRRALCLIK